MLEPSAIRMIRGAKTMDGEKYEKKIDMSYGTLKLTF